MSFSLIFLKFLWCRYEPMDIYLVDSNTMLVVVYYNSGKVESPIYSEFGSMSH